MWLAGADLGGVPPDAPPPTAQNFLNFMQFFAKFGKIICWRPSPGSWHPLLQGILDPPLVSTHPPPPPSTMHTTLESDICYVKKVWHVLCVLSTDR